MQPSPMIAIARSLIDKPVDVHVPSLPGGPFFGWLTKVADDGQALKLTTRDGEPAEGIVAIYIDIAGIAAITERSE